ncbi:hypothetical protein PSHI_06960 [Pseudomonas sp. URMO17WK12:I11]|nr:hypothetical protein PSHI_06960 [Pseudomonas sp. URMO17WK12:I11]
MQVLGSAGNWIGFYVRAYDVNTNQPNGRYFAATFGVQPVATYGMRLWDGSSKLLFDSGTPMALFTRAFQNWTYVRSETTTTGSTSSFYTVSFNFPENEYLLINTFGMNMLTGSAAGRLVKTCGASAPGRWARPATTTFCRLPKGHWHNVEAKAENEAAERGKEQARQLSINKAIQDGQRIIDQATADASAARASADGLRGAADAIAARLAAS